MLKQIAYISYPVRDMDRAVDFYRNVLGMKLQFQREDWSEFDIGGQRLALQKVEKIQSGEPPAGAVVSFFAESIEGVINSLKEREISIVGDLQVFSYGKIAYFKDPDGNTLGLYEPPKV